MKISRSFLLAALFGAITAHAETTPEDCPDGSCAPPAWATVETNAPAAPALVVLSPVPESAVAPIAPAPRLDTLDGKTIALAFESYDEFSRVFLVTGDPSRNKVLTVPGGGFATVRIELPRDWDALMAARGYAPLSSFRVAPAPGASASPTAPAVPSARDRAWRSRRRR